MGGSVSSEKNEKQGKKHRPYIPPSHREKERFNPPETMNVVNPYDAAIDKFDYLFVFPFTTPVQDPTFLPWKVENDSSKTADIKSFWMNAVAGGSKEKRLGAKELHEYWKSRLRIENDKTNEITMHEFLTITREMIIEKLTSNGVQCKLTVRPGGMTQEPAILCRIRVPILLLEDQASKDDYKLELKAEIDPGSKEFWNKEIVIKGKLVAAEIEEESKLYSKEEANQILEKLFRVGKISAVDVGVNPMTETQETWSRRVHALERIADRVPVHNTYPCYATFSSDPTKRYVYQNYQSVRGKTLFRSKDRLYLTKTYLDQFFDLDILKELDEIHGIEITPVLSDYYPLHDSNRGEKITLELLQRRWTTFWRASAKEVGSPTVTHYAYEEDEELYFFLRPFSQPLHNIREYFGEKIGLYFAWIGHYTYYLILPSLLGIAMESVCVIRGYEQTINHLDWPRNGYFLLLILWSIFFLWDWKVETKAISLKWGTRGFEKEEKDRPQFDGEPVRSEVNNKMKAYFDESIRDRLIMIHYLYISLAIFLDLILIASVFIAQWLMINHYSEYYFSWMPWLISFILALLINLGNVAFLPFSRMLNDMENHRTETEYEDALISKTLIFQLFNNFSALIFTAFGKYPLLGTCDLTTCITDLRLQLYALVIVRFAFVLWELIYPTISISFQRLLDKPNNNNNKNTNGKSDIDGGGGGGDEEEGMTRDNKEFENELFLTRYDGTFSSYSHAVIQFGYVMMFSLVFPLQPLIALGENILKIRMDALKLCSIYRRPDVFIAEDIGTWGTLMEVMSLLGVIISVGILVFTYPDMDNYSLHAKWIIFLTIEQILLILKYALMFTLNEEPDWIKEIALRHEYVEDKWAKAVASDKGGNMTLQDVQQKLSLDENIDVDGIGLLDLRKKTDVSMTEQEYQLSIQLEKLRRDLLRQLKNQKTILIEYLEKENYNYENQIGEKKSGLPLGRLSVDINKISQCSILPPSECKSFRTRLRLVNELSKKIPTQNTTTASSSSSSSSSSIMEDSNNNNNTNPVIVDKEHERFLKKSPYYASHYSISNTSNNLYLDDLLSKFPPKYLKYPLKKTYSSFERIHFPSISPIDHHHYRLLIEFFEWPENESTKTSTTNQKNNNNNNNNNNNQLLTSLTTTTTTGIETDETAVVEGMKEEKVIGGGLLDGAVENMAFTQNQLTQYDESKIFAFASIHLEELADQHERIHYLYLYPKNLDSEQQQQQLQPEQIRHRGKLEVKLMFNYSKVKPTREHIELIQSRLNSVEKELSLVKSGKKDFSKPLPDWLQYSIEQLKEGKKPTYESPSTKKKEII